MNSFSDEVNPYLEQEVYSASPIRLRWMLIRRAEELCVEVRRLWEIGENDSAAGWLLRIREILGELLDGVQDKQNPVSQTVSDFYIFLLQLLSQAEEGRDRGKLEILHELLGIESETWSLVIRQLHREDEQLHREDEQLRPAPTGQIAGLNPLASPWNITDLSAGLNLEL